jgi:hypothetical protein
MEQINENKFNEIKIKKNFIKTEEDFVNIVKKEYDSSPYDENFKCREISIVKNYLSSIEFSKILTKFDPNVFEYLCKINL